MTNRTARSLVAVLSVALMGAAPLGCSSDESPAGPGPGGTGGTAGSGGSGASGGSGGTAGAGGAGGSVAPMGPLTVHSANPRYFATPAGTPLYLASTYGGNTLQDQADITTFDWPGHVDYLAEHDINLAKFVIRDRCQNHGTIAPTLYARTGPGDAVDGEPKLDLTQINPAFIDQLRSRTQELQDRGIYVVVMFFNRFDVVSGPNSWDASAYHPDNNINGIDGDTNADGEGKEVQTLPLEPAIEDLERARIHAIVDAVNEFDNVIYEVCNETYGDSAWQEWVTDEIRAYQATKPQQHLVGQTATWPSGSNDDLLASSADWISPEHDNDGDGDYEDNPPQQDGTKVVIVDSDHVTAGQKCTPVQVWKYFTTGAHPMCYEGWDIALADTHDAMTHTRSYSARLDLAQAVPQGDLSSTGYCLAQPGMAYLAFQPTDGPFTVDLEAGSYAVEWFDVTAGTAQSATSVTVTGGSEGFTPPFSGPGVLLLQGE